MKIRQRPAGDPHFSGRVQIRIIGFDQYGRVLPARLGGTSVSFMVEGTTVAECRDFIYNAFIERERTAELDKKEAGC